MLSDEYHRDVTITWTPQTSTVNMCMLTDWRLVSYSVDLMGIDNGLLTTSVTNYCALISPYDTVLEVASFSTLSARTTISICDARL